MKILQINGSARREGANSTRVADAIVARLKAKNPAATVVRRDLASNPFSVSCARHKSATRRNQARNPDMPVSENLPVGTRPR